MFAALLTITWWLAPFILMGEAKGNALVRLMVECCVGSVLSGIILAFVFSALEDLLTSIRGVRLVSYTLGAVGILIMTALAVINFPEHPGGFLVALAFAFGIPLIGVPKYKRHKAPPRFTTDVSRYRSREECSLNLLNLNLNRRAPGPQRREP